MKDTIRGIGDCQFNQDRDRGDCYSEGSMSNPMYRNIVGGDGQYLPMTGRCFRRHCERRNRKENRSLWKTKNNTCLNNQSPMISRGFKN